jgi:hypothetical protein
VQVRRDLLALQAEHRLDQPGDAGGGLQVPEVGLHRADPGADARRALAQRRAQGLEFDRIPQRGAGAVRLHVPDLGGCHPGVGQCLGDEPLLRRAVGHGQAAAGAVLVDGGSEDGGEHLIAVGQRPGERLEHHHAAALAPVVAVGGGVEGLAAAVPGQGAGRLAGAVDGRAQDGVDPARQRHLALAGAQAADGQVHGDQRGGAGGVDGEAGAVQAEEVRQAA